MNVAHMAEHVATELLGRFGWEFSGPNNENFACEKIEDHKKKDHPYHPVDGVFWYDDPYSNSKQYFLADFKSYARESIKPNIVKTAITNLSSAVDCANISQLWQDRYVNTECAWEVHGLLFIYNHDGGFDSDFMKLLSGVKNSSLLLPSRSRVYVIGPERIEYLINMLNDIDVQRGNDQFPRGKKINVSYPDLVTARPNRTVCTTSRIELLLGPWQVLPYEIDDNGGHRKGVFIYYACAGESPQEFEFLFDYAFKSQLVQPDVMISIRMSKAHENAAKNFEVAKDNFYDHFRAFTEVRSRLNQFTLHTIDTVRKEFSSVRIGMGDRNG